MYRSVTQSNGWLWHDDDRAINSLKVPGSVDHREPDLVTVGWEPESGTTETHSTSVFTHVVRQIELQRHLFFYKVKTVWQINKSFDA